MRLHHEVPEERVSSITLVLVLVSWSTDMVGSPPHGPAHDTYPIGLDELSELDEQLREGLVVAQSFRFGHEVQQALGVGSSESGTASKRYDE